MGSGARDVLRSKKSALEVAESYFNYATEEKEIDRAIEQYNKALEEYNACCGTLGEEKV